MPSASDDPAIDWKAMPTTVPSSTQKAGPPLLPLLIAAMWTGARDGAYGRGGATRATAYS